MELLPRIGRDIPATRGPASAMTAWTAEDGTTWVVGTGLDGLVRQWDSVTGVEGQPLQGLGPSTAGLTSWQEASGAWRLAAADIDGHLLRWDASTGARIGSVSAIRDADGAAAAATALRTVTTLSGGVQLVAMTSSGTVSLWDASTGAPVGTPFSGAGAADDALAAWVDANGRTVVATADGIGRVRCRDAVTAAVLHDLQVSEERYVTALGSWKRRDGRIVLVIALENGSVHQRDAATGAVIDDLPTIPVDRLTTMVVTSGPSGTRIVVGAYDGRVGWWNPEAGAEGRRESHVHESGIWRLAAWTRPLGGVAIASFDFGGTLHRHDAKTGTTLGEAGLGGAGSICAITSWTDEDDSGVAVLAAGSSHGSVSRWNARTGAPIGRTLRVINGPIHELLAYRDGGRSCLAVAGAGMLVRWDLAAGRRIGAALETGDPQGLSVKALCSWERPGGGTGLAAAVGTSLLRWDSTTGAPLGKDLVLSNAYRKHLLTTTDRNGRIVLWATDGDLVRRWDAETGEPVGVALPVVGGVANGLVSWARADGSRLVAAVSWRGRITWWDAATGEPPRTRGRLGFSRRAQEPLASEDGLVPTASSLAVWHDAAGEAVLSHTDPLGGLTHRSAVDGTVRTPTHPSGHESEPEHLVVWRDAQGTGLATAAWDTTVGRFSVA